MSLMSASITSRVASESEDASVLHPVHLCNGLDPRRDGGMVPSILGMTSALAGRGSRVRIVTPTPSRLDPERIPSNVALDGPEVNLEAAVHDADVVHIHGLWQGHGRRGAREASRSGVPYMIAAHGMAEPWALRQKRLKKLVYTALVEGKNLGRACCLHALTRPEVDHLRKLAPRAPVALIPNGVDLAPYASLPDRSKMERECPGLIGKFVLAFVGRIHRKKGFDLLAPALAAVAADHPEIHLLMAGIDDGALIPFLNDAESLGIRDRITYVGHVSGGRALEVWGAADAFVLPSHSEGFSMAVLEALACSLPTLITETCHFPELEAADGGLVVAPTVAGVTAGLRSLLERSHEQRQSLGNRGRALVSERYTWDRQAERLVEVYRWMIGGGDSPEALVS